MLSFLTVFTLQIIFLDKIYFIFVLLSFFSKYKVMLMIFISSGVLFLCCDRKLGNAPSWVRVMYKPFLLAGKTAIHYFIATVWLPRLYSSHTYFIHLKTITYDETTSIYIWLSVLAHELKNPEKPKLGVTDQVRSQILHTFPATLPKYF